MRHTLTILATLILTACGGGGDATTEQHSAAPSGCKATVTVALYGDSTMHSGGIATVEAQRHFDATFGAGRVVVSNYAVPGTLGVDVAPVMRPDWFDVSVANFGLNDCDKAVSLDAYRTALRTMLARGLTVLETPNPATRIHCSAYADAVVEVGVAVIDTEAHVAAAGGAQLVDGVHPTATQYADIARFRAESLVPLVAARLCGVR